MYTKWFLPSKAKLSMSFFILWNTLTRQENLRSAMPLTSGHSSLAEYTEAFVIKQFLQFKKTKTKKHNGNRNAMLNIQINI